jgi:hypothetical protein
MRYYFACGHKLCLIASSPGPHQFIPVVMIRLVVIPSSGNSLKIIGKAFDVNGAPQHQLPLSTHIDAIVLLNVCF